ncbi:MAG: DNA-binding response regulator, partial [Verrucomicrobia subdivision 3 bacterium]|nr:DNA-binding response regulator [Limisphaerales bacterium]
TVETHRERIMRKLDIHSIAGLTRFAIAQGMVSLMPASLPQLPAAA